MRHYDKTHNEVFRKVAEEHNLTEDEVKEAYDGYWHTVSDILKEKNMLNCVVVPNLGKWDMNPRKFWAQIKRAIRKFKEGLIDRELMENTVRLHWSYLEFLRKYHKRKGKGWKKRQMRLKGVTTLEELSSLSPTTTCMTKRPAKNIKNI